MFSQIVPRAGSHACAFMHCLRACGCCPLQFQSLLFLLETAWLQKPKIFTFYGAPFQEKITIAVPWSVPSPWSLNSDSPDALICVFVQCREWRLTLKNASTVTWRWRPLYDSDMNAGGKPFLLAGIQFLSSVMLSRAVASSPNALRHYSWPQSVSFILQVINWLLFL